MGLIELTEAFLAAKQHAFAPNTRRAYQCWLLKTSVYKIGGHMPARPLCLPHRLHDEYLCEER